MDLGVVDLRQEWLTGDCVFGGLFDGGQGVVSRRDGSGITVLSMGDWIRVCVNAGGCIHRKFIWVEWIFVENGG